MYSHGSLVTSNLRVGSVSLVLIQRVSKGNNYCILFYCIFKVTFCFGLEGRWFAAARSSHISCVTWLWNAVPRLCPSHGAWAGGNTEKTFPQNVKEHWKRAQSSILVKPFALFPVSSLSSGKPCVPWSCFCVFGATAGAAVPPPDGRAGAACAKHSEPALEKWGSFDSGRVKNTFDRQAKRWVFFFFQLPSYITGELMWHLHGSALRGELSLYK